jgi:hypothetical protein
LVEGGNEERCGGLGHLSGGGGRGRGVELRLLFSAFVIVNEGGVCLRESILEKNIYYNCPNCREKKNNQHTRPAGPGRLRSWSGPVDPEFQGRLRFSYDSRPGRVPGQCELG